MRPVFVPFITPGGNYVYDANRNSILKIDKGDYDKLVDACSDRNILENEVIKKFQENGFLMVSNLKNLVHPHSSMLEYYIKNRVEKITLQVTQECNLRCSYCSYSGNYDNRGHSIKGMTFDVAKRGIDFLLEHSKDRRTVNIGFYGGEPLLEKKLIEECIEYAEKIFVGKKVTYTMTTNGTLINDEIIEFFMKHNFSVLISLDGPKEIHDKNRRLANGKGCFDLIMKNIKRVKEKYPEFLKNIEFNVVISPGNDLKCINDFFEAEDVITSEYINRTTLAENYAKKAHDYDEKFYVDSNYEKFKLYLWLLKKISKKNVSKLFIQDFSRLKLNYEFLAPIKGLPETYHHAGPCLPGVRRPLITVDGDIMPCERVSEESEIMKLGDIYTGIEVEKAKTILNVGQVTKEECKNCWCILQCTMCAANADNHGSFSKEKKVQSCRAVRDGALENMKNICFLIEHGFDMEHVFRGLEEEKIS